MSFLPSFRAFARNEDGAVTVDWVVLTAAIVGLGLVVMSTVSAGAKTAASNISADIKTKAVAIK